MENIYKKYKKGIVKVYCINGDGIDSAASHNVFFFFGFGLGLSLLSESAHSHRNKG